MFYYAFYKSPIGKLTLISTETALTELRLANNNAPLALGEDMPLYKPDLPILAQCRAWLDAYFSGKKPDISNLSLSPKGSDFQRKVWLLLTEIPYGETVSYKDMAQKIAPLVGKAKMSAQAVGGAVGKNPIALIIPCHRVIGQNGKLVGYGGGLDVKQMLLALEQKNK